MGNVNASSNGECRVIDIPPPLAPFEYCSQEVHEEQVKQMQSAEKGRRGSVSAAPVGQERIENWGGPPVYEKDEDHRRFLRECIMVSPHLQVLFGHLSETDLEAVISAFFLKEVEAQECVIRQGDDGDYFYIVIAGDFDIFVQRPGHPAVKVMEASAGHSFGELALLYNAPRAATVMCVSRAQLWALDRDTFQMMLVTAENTKPREYESLLGNMAILQDLNQYEIGQLSDMLTADLYDGGEVICQQGEEGNFLWILQDGEARAYITGNHGEIEVKHYYTPGDYFGEISLLTREPRRATIRAVGQGCSVLSVGLEDFEKSAGLIKGFLLAHIEQYPPYEAFLQ